MEETLNTIAEIIGGRVIGDENVLITGVANISAANNGDLTFLLNKKYEQYLSETNATAVILSEEFADSCPVNAIVVDNVHVGYARAATYLAREKKCLTGVHPSAVISPSATIADSAYIGPNTVVDEYVVIADNVFIEANCYLGKNVSIEKNSKIKANVSIYAATKIGERCLIHSGTVVGSDGFGLANDNGNWVKIPQLGCVIMGNDVEIGSNASIDRGAIDNTILHDGVKIDNLVHVAHNVEIGCHTAIAAGVGIAGSTKVGASCTFGGMVGVSGHLTIADQVHLNGMAMVTKSISEAGAYASGSPAEPVRVWRKNVVKLRQIEKIEKRIKSLESELNALKGLKG